MFDVLFPITVKWQVWFVLLAVIYFAFTFFLQAMLCDNVYIRLENVLYKVIRSSVSLRCFYFDWFLEFTFFPFYRFRSPNSFFYYSGGYKFLFMLSWANVKAVFVLPRHSIDETFLTFSSLYLEESSMAQALCELVPGKQLQLVVQDVKEDGSALFSGSCVTGLTVTATRYHLGGEGLFFDSLLWFSLLDFETSLLKLILLRDQLGRSLIRLGMDLRSSLVSGCVASPFVQFRRYRLNLPVPLLHHL